MDSKCLTQYGVPGLLRLRVLMSWFVLISHLVFYKGDKGSYYGEKQQTACVSISDPGVLIFFCAYFPNKYGMNS